jgi:GNAT superfamily N-acetyltransferase
MPYTFKQHLGNAINEVIDEIAKLRMTIFREFPYEFPYMYEGSLEYERRYLQTYAQCSEAILVLVYDGNKVIGGVTGMPLSLENAETKGPFIENQLDLATVFYLGEILLYPEYRQQGLGKRLETFIVDYAKGLGFKEIALCSVARNATHPQAPAGYYSATEIWPKWGYESRAELVTEFSWQDVGDDKETKKPMNYFTKSIAPGSAVISAGL